MTTDVLVVDSGVANLASVLGSLHALGLTVECSRRPEDIASASRLVLPGVGSYAAALETLNETGSNSALREAVTRGVPTLAICLGLQLLLDGSDESPGRNGLGLVTGRARRLPADVRVPHLGWNQVRPEPSTRWLDEGWAAFAHSFALQDAPPDCCVAWSEHGTRFVAALERDNLLACQFHPELSSTWGHALLTRWLRDEPCRRATSSPPSSDRASSVRRVVPCLDVRDGRVLKGVQFSGLRDVGDPAELAALHERHGADEIVVLDIGATPSRRDTQVETVRRVRAALRIPLTAGGGVRGVDDARALLTAGADKVTVNTAAVRRPELLAELASAFGRQCVVLAVDVRRRKTSPGSMPRWEVLVSGGHEPTGRDALEWIAEATELGAGEVLLTSWDRDGTRAGCDLASLDATRRVTTVPLIASGGIGTAEHVVDAVRAGADAVLAASVLHDRELTVNDLKQALAAAGLPTRPPLEPVMNEEVP